MAHIFICYRRDDAGYVAGMLCERLKKEFGPASVFIDVDTIPLGVDFREHLNNAVSKCDVFLAIIGDSWLGSPNQASRRIDDPTDYIRIEIEAALQRDIPIIPVLVGKAHMPMKTDLPEPLRPIAFRNAAELRSGRDMNHHVDSLIRGLRPHFAPSQADNSWESEAEQRQRQVGGLYREAQALLKSESWDAAIKKLQAVLDLEPAHKDAAAQSRSAHRQQELSALYDRGRKHSEDRQWRKALENFQRVQKIAGHYKDVSDLVAFVQSQMVRKRTPIRAMWIIGVLALLMTGGVIVLMERPSDESPLPTHRSPKINVKAEQLTHEASILRGTSEGAKSQAGKAQSICNKASDSINRLYRRIISYDDDVAARKFFIDYGNDELRAIKADLDKSITTADEAVSDADKAYQGVDALLQSIPSQIPNEKDAKTLELYLVGVKTIAEEARASSASARTCGVETNDKIDRLFIRKGNS